MQPLSTPPSPARSFPVTPDKKHPGREGKAGAQRKRNFFNLSKKMRGRTQAELGSSWMRFPAAFIPAALFRAVGLIDR
jgi:hypothetical protein